MALWCSHVRPYLAAVALRELPPEAIGRWQAKRVRTGAGPVAIRHALDLLGSILEHAVQTGRIPANPARRVRKAQPPRREATRALAPATVGAMRGAFGQRDATLLSVLAYAGLRPGCGARLRWGDVRDRTLLVQRAISLGKEADTTTRQHRTVRLLAPLASDLRGRRRQAIDDSFPKPIPIAAPDATSTGRDRWLRCTR